MRKNALNITGAKTILKTGIKQAKIPAAIFFCCKCNKQATVNAISNINTFGCITTFLRKEVKVKTLQNIIWK